MAHQLRPRSIAVLAALLTLLAAACSSAASGADRRDVTPTTFALHRFDRLPKPTRTHPVGLRSDQRGVTVRSYEARNRTPEDVLAFYDRVLATEGWTAVPSATESGSPHQRTFRSGRYLLRITAELAPTLGEDAPVTQFSLEVTRPSSAP